MSLPQKKFREIVFQALFCEAFCENEKDELIDILMREQKITKKNAISAIDFANKVKQNQKEIDESIKEASVAYDLGRISSSELNVLRVGVFELIIEKKLSEKIVIAEAIRICRKYATSSSANYINAVLDSIYKKSLKNECTAVN
jgi:transcription antitermination protein NusB